jgi:cytochrome c oxidase assembly protein subunit 11
MQASRIARTSQLTRFLLKPLMLARTRARHSSHAARPPPPPLGPDPSSAPLGERNATIAVYFLALAVGVAGLSYAAVPLYKVFCQATGFGGTTQTATAEQFKGMKPVPGARRITVYFNADTSASMPWRFVPQQKAVRVVPGETALAFYTATNPTSAPVTGVSTYNITPMRAALYFHKIQCFCFEEQRLKAGEEIDMPVFFYIDPKFLEDPNMANVESLTLSYTFFRSGEKEVIDIAHELAQKGGGDVDEVKAKVAAWTTELRGRTGVGLAAVPPTAAAAPAPTTGSS